MTEQLIEQHFITREIGIDMGHRVTYHGSKCKNLHGHRYTIQATCVGPLYTEGEQQGMVLDFGFLKEEMMAEIDEPCDHGMCLWLEDSWTRKFLATVNDKDCEIVREAVEAKGYCAVQSDAGKYYIVPFVPTAENLAKHWYTRLKACVYDRTNGQATLDNIKVW